MQVDIINTAIDLLNRIKCIGDLQGVAIREKGMLFGENSTEQAFIFNERKLRLESFYDILLFFTNYLAQENSRQNLNHPKSILRSIIEQFLIFHFFESLEEDDRFRFSVQEYIYAQAFINKDILNGEEIFEKEMTELLSEVNSDGNERFHLKDCVDFFHSLKAKYEDYRSLETSVKNASGKIVAFSGVTAYLRLNKEKIYDKCSGLTSRNLYVFYSIHSKSIHGNPYFTISNFNERIDLRFQVASQLIKISLSFVAFIDEKILNNIYTKETGVISNDVKKFNSQFTTEWRGRK